jgi:hypothetical protein
MSKNLKKNYKSNKRNLNNNTTRGILGSQSINIHRAPVVYPDTLRTVLRMDMRDVYTGTYFYSKTFTGNSLMLCGPQTNWTGSFASNVPTGLSYLLSSNATAGSTAPYNTYFVRRSRITVELSPSASANIPILMCLVPSMAATPSLAGQNLQSIIEQPYSVHRELTTLQANVVKLSNIMTTQKANGLQYVSNLENIAYRGTVVTTTPSNQWWWNLVIGSVDATTNCSGFYNVYIEYEVEFLNRNTFSTTVPS